MSRQDEVFEFVKAKYEENFEFPKPKVIAEHFGFNYSTTNWYLGILVRVKKLRLVDPTASVKQYRVVK